jgi:uncharacterized protein (TIGR02453 family)
MASKTKTSAPVEALPYFRPEALKFLRGLARNNDREWFQPRKAIFDAELKEPMLALVRKVNESMINFAPDYVRPAEKSLFRIYRDTRFSADKAPYKNHVAAWWAREGLEKVSCAGFYLHLEPKQLLIAAGVWLPQKEQLHQIRQWLLEHHTEFRKLLESSAVRKTFPDFEGNPLVRAPKGYDPEHPAIDLVRCRQWGLSVSLPVETAYDPKLAALVVRHCKAVAPLVEALNTPLLASLKPKRRLQFAF